MESGKEITDQLIFMTSMILSSACLSIGIANKPLKNKYLVIFFTIIAVLLFNFLHIKKFRLDVFFLIVFCTILYSISAHFLFKKLREKK